MLFLLISRLDDGFFLYGIPIVSEFLNVVLWNISTCLTPKRDTRVMFVLKATIFCLQFFREKTHSELRTQNEKNL